MNTGILCCWSLLKKFSYPSLQGGGTIGLLKRRLSPFPLGDTSAHMFLPISMAHLVFISKHCPRGLLLMSDTGTGFSNNGQLFTLILKNLGDFRLILNVHKPTVQNWHYGRANNQTVPWKAHLGWAGRPLACHSAQTVPIVRKQSGSGRGWASLLVWHLLPKPWSYRSCFHLKIFPPFLLFLGCWISCPTQEWNTEELSSHSFRQLMLAFSEVGCLKNVASSQKKKASYLPSELKKR